MKMRVMPAAHRKLIDWSAWREAPYVLYSIGGAIAFMGLYVPFFYVQAFAISERVVNENLGFYLLSVLNAASVFGRIIPNFVADKTGPMNVIIPCSLLSGILTLCLIPVHNAGGIIVFCILYGFFSGALVSIAPTVLVTLSPNRGIIGTRMGMSFVLFAIGVLIGAPIAGAILKAASFQDVWIFGGLSTIVGSLIMGGARVAKMGWKVKVKG